MFSLIFGSYKVDLTEVRSRRVVVEYRKGVEKQARRKTAKGHKVQMNLRNNLEYSRSQ